MTRVAGLACFVPEEEAVPADRGSPAFYHGSCLALAAVEKFALPLAGAAPTVALAGMVGTAAVLRPRFCPAIADVLPKVQCGMSYLCFGLDLGTPKEAWA